MKQFLCLSGILIGLMLPCWGGVLAKAEALKLIPSTPAMPTTWQGIRSNRFPFMDSKQIAITAFQQGQFQQAHVLLHAWHEEHPEDLEVLYYLSQSSYQLQDFTRSKRYVDILQSIAPQASWTQKASQWAVNIPELQVDAKTLSQNNTLLSTLKSVVDNQLPDLEFSSTLEESKETQKISSLQRVPYVSPESSETLTPASPNLTSELPTLAEAQIQNVPPTTPTMEPKAEASSKPIMGEKNTKTNTSVLTQEQIAQNFQMLQQLMMMQMMSQSNNNGMNPMMLQMMGQGNLNALGTSPSNQTMNPQIFSQMMQNSLLNNMNGLFNTNDNNNSNSNGFGF